MVHMVLCFAKATTLFVGVILVKGRCFSGLVIFMPVFEASDAERIYVSQNQSTTLFVGVILVKGRCFSG